MEGVPATFSVASSVTPMPSVASVQWDFNYDGSNFVPDSGASGLSATTTPQIVGDQTVAAQITDSAGNSQIVSLDINVATAYSIQASSQTIMQGDSIGFSVISAVSTAPMINSVQWDFNYDGSDFIADPSASGANVTSTLNLTGANGRGANHRHERQHPDRHAGYQRRRQPVLDPKQHRLRHPRRTGQLQPGVVGDAGAGLQFSAVGLQLRRLEFHPGRSGDNVTNTFNNVGNQTVAAEFTDGSGSTLLVTLAVSVGTAFSIQASSQAPNQGESVTFSLASAASPAPSYSSVKWNFNYDGTDFFSDASGSSATTALNTPGTQTVAAQITDMSGHTEIITLDATVNAVSNGVWIGADSSQITAGDTVDYSLTNTAGTTPSYASVQWDFNYDGVNFVADPSASGPTATATMNTTGNVVVAAKATDDSGNSQIFTFEEPVDYAPPTLQVPAGMTVTAEVSVPLAVTATSSAGIASVQWQVSFDNGDYQPMSITGFSGTYVFPQFGEYDIDVLVTDNNGQTAEDTFHVRADEDVPTATASGSARSTKGRPRRSR